ncbi:hypothetical protein BB029_13010 [Pseudomonas sp. S3E12]|nr:hypothetical protein BB029_13010 [Pseudomonas sp. S3E12]
MPGLLNCWRILIILTSLLMSDLPQASASIGHGIAVASKAQPAAPESLERRHFASGVLRLTDLNYATSADNPTLPLDLYLPPKPDAARPLIVYGTAAAGRQIIHEYRVPLKISRRCWLTSLRRATSWLRSITGSAARRYSRRRSTTYAPRCSLQAHHELYAIDVKRVALWGGSAGAQLAALAALDYSPQAITQKT